MKFRIILFTLAISLFVSCSRSLHPAGGQNKLVIYPSPPDTARIQFLMTISNSVDVEGGRRGFKKFILGKEEEIPIGKPYGVNIFNGKIYICDGLKHGLEIIDLKKNTFRDFIPTAKGELKNPINCFVDKNEYLYVADGDRKQIVVFDEKGEYFASFGEKENFKPTDVFIRDNKIWVSNLAGHQINVYSNDAEYKLLNKFPEVNLDSTGYLFSPTNIFVTDNNVYVTDFGDFKVKIYTKEGQFVKTVGTYGEGLGQFARPKGIAVDLESNLYVVDAGFENVQIFDKNGKLLMFFGGNYKGPGDMWLPAKLTIDYDNLQYFEKYVDPSYHLKYLILVTNQFGPDKLNIYGHVEPMTPELKENKQQKK
jgi:DNA-binding beta-propeller fold protein YncE